MIPFKAGNRKFQVPTDWSELTLDQTIRLLQIKDQEDWAAFLNVLTDLPYEDCCRISQRDFIILLTPVLEFLKKDLNNDELMNRPLPDKIELAGKIITKYNKPGEMVWAQHLSFENISANKEISDIEKLPDIIAICIQEPETFSEKISEQIKPDILKLSLMDAFAIGGHFLKAITEFYKRNKLKDGIEYSSEQIRAGIKEFSKFGAFNSIDTLAGGDITKWSQVVMLPMSDVILKLMMNQQQYRYEKKYHEILSKKK